MHKRARPTLVPTNCFVSAPSGTTTMQSSDAELQTGEGNPCPLLMYRQMTTTKILIRLFAQTTYVSTGLPATCTCAQQY